MNKMTSIILCLFIMISLAHAQKVVPMLRIEKSEDGTIRVFDMQGNEIKDGQTASFNSGRTNTQQTAQSGEEISSRELKMMEDIWQSTNPEALKVQQFFKHQQGQEQLMLGDFDERAARATWEVLSAMDGSTQKEKYKDPVDPEIQAMIDARQKQIQMHGGSTLKRGVTKDADAVNQSRFIPKPFDESNPESAQELEKIRAKNANNTTMNPGPNLTIDSGESYYSYSYPNLTFHIRVVNDGTSSADYSYLGYYLSTNDYISTSDTEIGEDYVYSLSAGSYSDEDETIDISSHTGTWYVGAYADHTNRVSEDNESDNTVVGENPIDVPPGGPNLTAGDQCSYSYSAPNLTYDIRVTNDGDESAGYSYLGYYLSTDEYWDGASGEISLGDDYVAGLSAGSYSDETETFDLEAKGIAAGTYYAFFYIDHNNNVSEIDEDDNIWYFTTPFDHVVSSPNLAPVSSNCSISYTCPTLTYNIRIENNGNGSAGSSYVGYYVSTNDIISTGDYKVGEDYVAALSAGNYSNEDETIDLSTKGLPSSVFWVGFIIDYTNQVSESDENDNDYVFSNEISHPCPNLTIDTGYTSMTYDCPNSPTLTYNVRVTNDGAGPAADSHLGYYLSTDNSTITTSDFYLGEDAVPQLSPGGYSDESETFNLDTKSVPTGTWYVAFIVDHKGEVSESDGGDNAWYFTTPINYPCAGNPDLTIEGQLVGGVNKLTWTCPNLRYELRIKNIGDDPAGSSYVGYYLSDNTTISKSDILLGDGAVPALNPAQYSNEDETFDLSTKSIPNGSYYAGFIIDYKEDVAEEKEDNNIFYWSSPKINWPCVADLTCLQVTLKSGSVQCGDAFYIRPTIKNEGGDAGPSHAKLYLSTDNDFDVLDDYWVQPKKSVPALVSNASHSLQWDFTFPNLGDGPKTVWVLVDVDCDNEVTESNESNVYKQSNTINYDCNGTPVVVLVPNGHEAWMPNTVHLISWDARSVTGAVRLQYSTDGGSSWRLIADNLANTGCYEWTVPNTVTQRAVVRVQSVMSASDFDVSDENFAIGELPTPYIIPSSISGESGEKVVDIRIKGNTRDISAFGLTLTYDPAHLKFVQVEKGALTQNWIQISGSENMPGEVTIGGFHTSALSINSTGSIARVRFNAVCNSCNDCSQSHLIISNLLDHVQGMNIGYGVYTYSSPCALGDVNMDGNITPADALCAFQIYLNGGNPTPGSDCDTDCALIAADANCNGSVTPEDALLIFKAYLDGKKSMQCPAAVAKKITGKELLLQDIVAVPGEEIKVPIRVSNTANLYAFGASLTYPSNMLEFKGFERSNYTADWFHIDAFEDEHGVIRFGGFDPNNTPQTQETALMTLHFIAKDNAAGSGEITLIDAVDDLLDAGVQTASVQMSNVANLPESFGLAQNYPNPFNMKTEIVYRLTESNVTELTIVDIRGNHVRTLVRANKQEGIHRVTWNGYSDQGAELATGIYFAILKSGQQHASIKMALIK